MEKIKLEYPIDQYFTWKDVLATTMEKYSSNSYLEYWKRPEDEHPSSLTYRQVDIITTSLAQRLESEFKIRGKPVAYLANHSLQYALYLIAFVKLECRLLLLSPRNSEPALVDLMNKTNTRVLLYANQFSKVATKVSSHISDGAFNLVSEVDIEQALQEENMAEKSLLASKSTSKAQLEDIAMIIHSSGTTGFPKPIYLSNRYLIMLFDGYNKVYKSIPSPKLLSFAPLFHVMGSALFAMALTGGTYVFPINFPPLSDTFTESLRRSQANCFVTPPVLLEQLVMRLKSNEEELRTLKNVKLGIAGGAALQDAAAKYLYDHDVNVKSVYGCTETGVAAYGDEDPDFKEFSPMKFVLPQEFYYLEDYDVASGTKHLVVKGSSPFLATNVSNRPDGSYATNDLFRPHSSKPGYWMICGRADDTLIMSNGEKTNPIPMEETIRNFHQVVSQCVVIGHGRSATAAIIQLDFEEATRRDIYDILNIVEAAIDVANRDAPSHSKIVFPEMVKVLPLSEQLPATDKGTTSRKKAEKLYAHYVEQMYSKFFGQEDNEKENKENANKLPLEPKTVSDFLRSTVASLLNMQPSEIETDVNVFDQGLDSLIATQLRNSIVKNVTDVATNFVFQNSTIESMTNAICQGLKDGGLENSYKQTKSLLAKYIQRIDEEMPLAVQSYQKKQDDGEVVVLTGSTGSLGALILQDLLQSSSVRKVYALVRGKNGMDRLHKSFEERSLDTSLLQSGKLQAYPLDQTQAQLGLTPEQYKNMQAEATMICHCAWMLDFLQPVAYYEKECLGGLFNLLMLAYRNGDRAMRFHFISSVSASMAMKGEVSEVPLPDEPTCAAPMGYAQSKFIAEHLMRHVADTKNIPTYVERVGQMSGDTVKGYWNPQEQYPLMIAGGAVHMKKMPMMDAQIDWIPLDFSASSIVEIMQNTANDAPSSKESIFHIINPNTVTWMDFLHALHDNGLEFENVSSEEWIKELSEDDTNPAFKLISFYQDVMGGTTMPVWLTTKTQRVSKKLATTPKLDAGLVGKYIQHWRDTHFFN